MRIKSLVFMWVLISFAAFGSENASPQEALDAPSVVGYVGTVVMIPNPGREQTTVALTMVSPPSSSASHQIVFLVQQLTSNEPPSWSGAARVLAAGGVLAIIPTNQQSGWLFKFPEIPIPPSMSSMNLSSYAAYGIARYGQKTPLTDPQILALAMTGTVVASKTSSSPDSTLSFSNTESPDVAKSCDAAGGAGAVSCSESAPSGIGNCSVSCGAGYYACCTGSECTCQKN
jgi:hypothetical protein